MAVRYYTPVMGRSASPSTPFGGTALTLEVPPETNLPGALCRLVDPDVFFPEFGDTEGEQTAKRICAACPVRMSCLNLAITRAEPEGIYGGLTAMERDALTGRSNGCGTPAGYKRHLRWGERPCRYCVTAHSAATVANQRTRRAQAA
jgi:hypothetical protein